MNCVYKTFLRFLRYTLLKIENLYSPNSGSNIEHKYREINKIETKLELNYMYTDCRHWLPLCLNAMLQYHGR